jgi:hypothetical protein
VRTKLRQDAVGQEVAAWRREQLVRSGFEARLAARLATAGSYDLHALIELVERGCPPEVAIRILASLGGGVAV